MTAASIGVPLPVVAARAPGGNRKVLPGFNLTLGYSLLYLSLIVLIPLSALFFKTFTLTWEQFWVAVTSPRVMASYRLTFGASLFAALVNLVFGLLLAWVLVPLSSAAPRRASGPSSRRYCPRIRARRRPATSSGNTPWARGSSTRTSASAC